MTKKKTVYIHIGTHKTGSTSIQRFMMLNSESLLKKDFYIPKSGYIKGHCNLAWQILKRKSFTPTKGSWNDLINEITKINQNNIIISSEDFSLLSYSQIVNLKKTLKEFDIKILVFLRNQDIYFKSLYFESILAAITTDNFMDFFYSQKYRGDYFQILSNWESVLGKGNINIIKYNSSNAIDSFLKALRINNEDFKNFKLRINKSEGWNTFVILRLINKYLFFYLKRKSKVTMNLNITKNRFFLRLSKLIRIEIEPSKKEILSHFEESNQKLKEKYGINLY